MPKITLQMYYLMLTAKHDGARSGIVVSGFDYYSEVMGSIPTRRLSGFHSFAPSRKTTANHQTVFLPTKTAYVTESIHMHTM